MSNSWNSNGKFPMESEISWF